LALWCASTELNILREKLKINTQIITTYAFIKRMNRKQQTALTNLKAAVKAAGKTISDPVEEGRLVSVIVNGTKVTIGAGGGFGIPAVKTYPRADLATMVRADELEKNQTARLGAKGAAARVVGISEDPENADLAPITWEDLLPAVEKIRSFEKRGIFYDLALGLVRAGHDVEGCILFLATFNSQRFRVAASDFDIDGLKNLLNCELRADFEILARYSIRDIDLNEHGSRVEMVFNRLKQIKGIECTGAAKVMQLKCPELFVMWDRYIRGQVDEKLYKDLPCVASRKWSYHEYDENGKGYVTFLSDIQNRFRGLPDNPTVCRTLAKSIDEFYYVEITLQIQDKEAREAIMKIAPRSESNAMTLKELRKSAKLTKKVAQQAVESLVSEGELAEVEASRGRQKGDANRYWLSTGVHEKKASDR
jgi:hypothetical protein